MITDALWGNTELEEEAHNMNYILLIDSMPNLFI